MLDCIRAGIREIINCVASSVVWADETMVIRFANSSKASLIGLPSVLAVVCFLACEFLFFTLVGIDRVVLVLMLMVLDLFVLQVELGHCFVVVASVGLWILLERTILFQF